MAFEANSSLDDGSKFAAGQSQALDLPVFSGLGDSSRIRLGSVAAPASLQRVVYTNAAASSISLKDKNGALIDPSARTFVRVRMLFNPATINLL